MNQPLKKYIIEAKEAESMAKSKNLTLPQLLPSLVKPAQNLARSPISKFAVGVVGLVSDGRIFLGANVEFPGLPLHHTIHGEQFLIANLAANAGGSRLLYVAVSATPCGHCRQFFQELRGISETQIVITDQPKINPDYKPLSSILPNPFGPYDLLDEHTPLILDKHNNRFSLKGDNLIIQNGNSINLSTGYEESLKTGTVKAARGSHALSLSPGCEETLETEALKAARKSHAPYTGCPSGPALMDDNLITQNGNPINLSTGFKISLRTEAARESHALSSSARYEETLETEALKAARESHAPYSGCFSGVALMDCEGNVYAGSYMESAAYNPSMMPVQAALVAYTVAGGDGYEKIVAAVLVEKEAAVVRQEDTVRLFMKNVSPKCVLRVVHCN